jgi:hypothetical protein
VVPEGDGKYPGKGYFISKARKRTEKYHEIYFGTGFHSLRRLYRKENSFSPQLTVK